MTLKESGPPKPSQSSVKKAGDDDDDDEDAGDMEEFLQSGLIDESDQVGIIQ